MLTSYYYFVVKINIDMNAVILLACIIYICYNSNLDVVICHLFSKRRK